MWVEGIAHGQRPQRVGETNAERTAEKPRGRTCPGFQDRTPAAPSRLADLKRGRCVPPADAEQNRAKGMMMHLTSPAAGGRAGSAPHAEPRILECNRARKEPATLLGSSLSSLPISALPMSFMRVQRPTSPTLGRACIALGWTCHAKREM
ncbi:hypothetical protein GQ55_7G322900 [Panicum hallii var. hallii]|uniref:Uncharacterized protein n=1 Tax=Panicum hallii var. hallii TaxID=1504633 RepID=A0A2T7D1D0_9POAL|nr:hypothetical protein GQ55_7G322900 [Panicum hallii var. hallii]